VPTQREEEQNLHAARERVERMVRRYAERAPYRLNPDPVTVEHVLAGLARNLLAHGGWYCPCRTVTGDRAEDRANICPCVQHHADIVRDGVCECGIFVSEDYAAARASAPETEREKEA
jgi:ferredoxin-thioredoxin reductase catalytic chain